jgi:hypothetical protein
MAWIKTVSMNEADGKLLQSLEETRKLYPQEYALPVESVRPADGEAASILMSHSLMPDVLRHAFSTFGALMQPDLPLNRRHHELIAATVSALNDCFY